MLLESPARAWLLPDEPVPVRLMNTVWADASGVHDDLGSPVDVDAWLDAAGIDRSGARATPEELAGLARSATRRGGLPPS